MENKRKSIRLIVWIIFVFINGYFPISHANEDISFIMPSEIIDKSIEWQISNDSEFFWIPPYLNQIHASKGYLKIPLQNLSELEGECYLRYRTIEGKHPKEWCEAVSFHLPRTNSNPSNDWVKPKFVSEEKWKEVKDFILPAKHPIRPQLDALFSKRVTTSRKTLKDVGFQLFKQRYKHHTIVAKHPLLRGYIIKLYTDEQPGIDEIRLLSRRIHGANGLRAAIKENHYQDYFRVPKKWLYPLPDDTIITPPLHRKNFILIVEGIEILEKSENAYVWKNHVTQNHLKGLYFLTSTLGLFDSIHLSNIPFSRDNRIAFIDTEYHHTWPVPFHHLLPNLNDKMRRFWQQLIDDGERERILAKEKAKQEKIKAKG